MPEFLRDALAAGPSPAPLDVLLRLVAAFAFGALVMVIYRRTRPAADVAPSFAATLVLLAILIAMVTQVIGDNVARAFSLVGALSIVRFRTVVRDTQDTAYVIFSVGVGMAAGAGNHAVAMAGILVVAVAAVLMRAKLRNVGPDGSSSVAPMFDLQVRVAIGHDPRLLLDPVLDEHVRNRQLMTMTTARQGAAVDVTYRTALPTDASADPLVKALNRLDGVQGITLNRIVIDKGKKDRDPETWRTS